MKKLFPLTTFQQDAVLKRLKELQKGVEDIVGINYEVDETSIDTLTSNDIEDFLELKGKVLKWRLTSSSNYHYVFVLNVSKSENQPYMYKLKLVGIDEDYGLIVDFAQQASSTISSDRIVNLGTLRAVTANVQTGSGDTNLTSLQVGSTKYKVSGGTKLYKHNVLLKTSSDAEHYRLFIITTNNTPITKDKIYGTVDVLIISDLVCFYSVSGIHPTIGNVTYYYPTLQLVTDEKYGLRGMGINNDNTINSPSVNLISLDTYILTDTVTEL